MATAAENERLGVLETKVNSIERDVTEIKGDVKSMIATQQSLALALASRQAAEDAVQTARVNTGYWLRFFSERGIALAAIALSLYVALTK